MLVEFAFDEVCVVVVKGIVLHENVFVPLIDTVKQEDEGCTAPLLEVDVRDDVGCSKYTLEELSIKVVLFVVV